MIATVDVPAPGNLGCFSSTETMRQTSYVVDVQGSSLEDLNFCQLTIVRWTTTYEISSLHSDTEPEKSVSKRIRDAQKQNQLAMTQN